MDRTGVEALRVILAATPWVERTDHFARALQGLLQRRDSGLLLVGPPAAEPWHLAAHLDDEARLAGMPQIAPTLLRWAPAPGAPAHLSVSIERLRSAGRDDTLLVVAPEAAPERLLDRVSDARRCGATVMAMDAGDADLEALAHEALTVPSDDLAFDAAQHLVSAALGETGGASGTQQGFRRRLARLLDVISGPPPQRPA